MLDLSHLSDIGFMILMFAVGLIFTVHGAPKLKNPAQVAAAYGAPKFVGTLHGLVEIAIGIAFVLEIYVQYAAVLAGLIMIGAIYFKVFKWKMPFMSMTATGWEFDLLILAACIAILTK